MIASDKDTTPTPGTSTINLPPGAKYRGAVVEVRRCLPYASTLSPILAKADMAGSGNVVKAAEGGADGGWAEGLRGKGVYIPPSQDVIHPRSRYPSLFL